MKTSLNIFVLSVSLSLLIFSSFVFAAAPAKQKQETRKLNIQLGAPFHDNAILQRDMKVPVWGWCNAGQEVSIEFAGQNKNTVAGKDGKWMVWLDPLKASFKPADMTIHESNGKKEVLKNILVGEVWLASGQSNMQWTVSAKGNTVGRVLVKNILKRVEAKQEKYPAIREFTVKNVVAMMHPIEKAEGAWATGEDFSGYSAIAFAFAYDLYRELNVPIGILNCSFSQTSIQAWTPRVGFRDGQDEYTKAIYKKVLETDPKSAEHKEAWKGFYDSILKQLADNKKAIKPKAVSAKPPGNTQGNRDASWLYNGKLNPVVPYGLRGAIWNQGYANAGQGYVYYNDLHNLIRGWRIVWNKPKLPVYFNQFYTPGSGSDKPVIGGAAEMRMGTWKALDIPYTGMASQIDIGGSIHYSHKTVSGQRLALHALKNEYGKHLVVNGPMYKNYTVKGNKLIVEFDYAENGLVVAEAKSNALEKGGTGFANPKIINNGEDRVKLAYIADENRIWYQANIKIKGNKLIASSEKVKSPRGIAYATGGVAFLPYTIKPYYLQLHLFIMIKKWFYKKNGPEKN